MKTTASAPALRRLNIIAGLFHLASAGALIALSNDFTLPVTTSFMEGPPGSGLGTVDVIYNMPLGMMMAAFLLVSSLAHFLISAPSIYERYAARLLEGRAPYRWAEYSISSSLMIVAIAMLTGITDIAALVAIAGSNAAMILFGDLQERQAGSMSWRPFNYGCLIGLIPWLVIGIYLLGPTGVPGFVYGIYVSLFVFFNAFALVMVAHYRRWGRFADYMYGERAYILLSFTAKSALAWQVFSATLAG